MPSAQDISTVIRETREKWSDEYGYTPKEINTGECLMFANEIVGECPGTVMKRTGDSDVLGSPDNAQYDVEPFHVWVFDGTFHYDVEVPDGVSDWRKLPFFKRAGFGTNDER